MNFELSLPLIVLALFSLLSLPRLYEILRTDHRKLVFLILPIFASLTILWSKNLLRGVLTAAVLWCMILSALAALDLIKTRRTRIWLLNFYLGAAIAVCLFCWLQMAIDLAGAPAELSLMCDGCMTQKFGFPRAAGFAVEPQFMGSLLIAPALIMLYILQHKTKKKQGKNTKAQWGRMALAIFIITTLFMTFSRGAIYSFVLAVLVVTVISIIRRSPRSLLPLGLTLLSFVLGLAAQGLFAAVSPTSETFTSGIAKSIDQLSLHAIDLTDHFKRSAAGQPARFDGYVAESTDIRIGLSSKALRLSASRPETFCFGVGLGAAGIALFEAFPELGWSKEIVQNEYLSVLLELGALGFAIALATVIEALKIYSSRVRDQQRKLYFYSALIAFSVSIFFFSGLPNALHIYLLPVIFAKF